MNDNHVSIEDYILNHFNNKEKSMFGFQHETIGIITSDEEKADKIFEEIFNKNKENVRRYIGSKAQKEILLKDNSKCYIWVQPHMSSKGHRLTGVYIDKDIDIKAFEEIIMPICLYCKRDDIKII